jgi:hypothetical protein
MFMEAKMLKHKMLFNGESTTETTKNGLSSTATNLSQQLEDSTKISVSTMTETSLLQVNSSMIPMLRLTVVVTTT